MCEAVLGEFPLVPFLNQQEVQRHDLFFEHGDRSFHSYYTGEKFLNLKVRKHSQIIMFKCCKLGT